MREGQRGLAVSGEARDYRREIIHRMGRRCREWDYSGRAIYMITVCLKERGRAVLAAWPEFRASSEFCASPETVKYSLGVSAKAQNAGQAQNILMPLTALGEKVLACWRRIPEFWPMVELLECQVMPDHFHGLIFVKESLGVSAKAQRNLPVSGQAQKNLPVSGQAQNTPKTLGDVIRGFKTGCREAGWEDGYVDNILFREGQLKRMAAYIRDNPRRLAEKRANPALFKRVEDLTINLAVSGEAQRNLPVSGQARNALGYCASAETPKFTAHFSAIGNAALLSSPVILQVQCSRSDFRYRRERLGTGGWKILRNTAGEPIAEYSSAAFAEKCRDALACAKNGATLISPCISHGEREIARLAHAAGAKVVALRNKGFAKFEKPNGALFEQCAAGNLLLLAPANWPYIPGEKPMTREQAQVLNRIAQLIADDGAAEINYRGAVMQGIDKSVILAVSSEAQNNLAVSGEANDKKGGME